MPSLHARHALRLIGIAGQESDVPQPESSHNGGCAHRCGRRAIPAALAPASRTNYAAGNCNKTAIIAIMASKSISVNPPLVGHPGMVLMNHDPTSARLLIDHLFEQMSTNRLLKSHPSHGPSGDCWFGGADWSSWAGAAMSKWAR